MKDSKRPLVIELCYLAATRNAINLRRHRARYRKNYYQHALNVVEAHLGSNSTLRHLESRNGTGIRDKQIKDIRLEMAYLKGKHPKPKKWLKMGLHQLRSMVLKGQGEYAMAKHETMEFTIKHRDRVRFLTSELICSMSCDNGSIRSIHFVNEDYSLYGKDINRYADQYELDQAVESMIEEK